MLGNSLLTYEHTTYLPNHSFIVDIFQFSDFQVGRATNFSVAEIPLLVYFI